jgi:hypothetical protein
MADIINIDEFRKPTSDAICLCNNCGYIGNIDLDIKDEYLECPECKHHNKRDASLISQSGGDDILLNAISVLIKRVNELKRRIQELINS